MLHLFRFVFLLLFPAMALPAMPEVPPPLPQASFPILSYDEILEWVEAIEENDLESFSSEEIEKSACFLALLAERGTSQNDPIALAVVKDDIHHLFSEVNGLDYQEFYAARPAVWNGNIDVLLCKSWIHKQSHNLKKFVHKHKTAIIIGAAVLVTAAVAVVAIAALTSTAAASSAIAAAGAALSQESEDRPSYPPPMNPNFLQVVEQITPVLESSPSLAKVVEENTASLTENLTQVALFEPVFDEAPKHSTLANMARNIGSGVAHEMLDAISTLVSDIPRAMQDIGEIGAKLFPEVFDLTDFENRPIDCVANFEGTVLTMHEKIDQAFSTNYIGKYTPEAKAAQTQMTLGILPPPMAFAKGAGRTLSIQEFKYAEECLAPLTKESISEAYARELIEQYGIPTFPRPVGIPENFIVKLSKGGGGIRYIHPENNHISVRVMPGKPHSPNPCQQKPYVIQTTDHLAFDKYGNKVPATSPEAHIPLEEFIYRND